MRGTGAGGMRKEAAGSWQQATMPSMGRERVIIWRIVMRETIYKQREIQQQQDGGICKGLKRIQGNCTRNNWI